MMDLLGFGSYCNLQRHMASDPRGQAATGKSRGNKVLQSFYKQELDNQMAEQHHQKQIDKVRSAEERRLFNDRMVQQEELEKLKDLSYKNYYQMVMNNQDTNFKNFKLSDERSSIKDIHIDLTTQEGETQLATNALERQKKIYDLKSQYRSELLQQLKEKETDKINRRSLKEEEKREGKRIYEISRGYAQEQKLINKETKLKYRNELDLLNSVRRDSSEPFNNYKGREKSMSTPILRDQPHNILINPLPFNIQNPYILKELHRNPNKGYFAGIATSNLQQ